MKRSRGTRVPRGAALTAAIMLVLSGTPAAQAVVNSTQHAGAAALRAHTRSSLPMTHRPATVTAVLPVLSCADDSGAGTLRSVIAAANEGDTIDLTALQCSQITLTQGAIPVLFDTLTINGPGAQKLAIDGARLDRVFVHPGYGSFTLSGLTVRNGLTQAQGTDATGGACLISLGYLTLDHSVVSGCTATGEGVYGAGAFAYYLTMLSSTLSDNVSLGLHPTNGTASFGGGAYVNYCKIYRSTIKNNSARHDPSNAYIGYETGGGIFSNRGCYILQSTISANYSQGIGGGISSFIGVEVVNSTISGNTAKNGGGGGINIRPFYGSTFSNSTIANNTARAGAGIYAQIAIAPLQMQSTIIANNHTTSGSAEDFDTSGDLTVSGANNLVRSVSALVHLPPGTSSADPLLQPLANNGGPTQTLALTIGSPAVDAGNNAFALQTDQRGTGFPRMVGVAPDIGAFEGALPPPVARPIIPAPAVSTRALLLVSALLMWFGARRLRRKESG